MDYDKILDVTSFEVLDSVSNKCNDPRGKTKGGVNYYYDKEQDYNSVIQNLDTATAEQISQQLDYFNGEPVMVNGTAYHPFNDPTTAARLNARYKELTGQDHPVYM